MRLHGHAKVNPKAPSAFAVCDRCGMLYNLDDLAYQMEWRGPSMMSTGAKICRKCTDKPQEQNRTIILPPDPVPRLDPRPENFDAEM